MSEAVSQTMLKKKMNSRERGNMKDKKKIIDKLREDRKARNEIAEDDEESLCSDTEIGDMDPETQWSLHAKMEDILKRAGITEEMQLVLSSGGAADPAVLAAQEKKRKAEEEEREAKLASQVKIEVAKAAIEAEKFKAATLAEHERKMREDPQYKAQFMIVLGDRNSSGNGAQQQQDGARSANLAKNTATETVNKLKASITNNVGVRRSLPMITDADLEDLATISTRTWEQKADEALEIARRSAVSAGTAINIANRLDAARQPTMMAFLPSGVDPRVLAEHLLYWYQQGWLPLDSGIVWLAARSTPARFGLTCEAAYGSAVASLNWCSGSSIRCVMDSPSEIGQQRYQFRDCMNFAKQMFAEVAGPDDPTMELVLCRPHRRSKAMVEAGEEDTSDWWSMAYYPPTQTGIPSAVCFIRCEYHHARQWMRYKFDPEVLKLWRMTRKELEDNIAQRITSYYLFDTKVEKDLQQVRSQKQESMAAKSELDNSPPAPAALTTEPAVQTQLPPTPQPTFDPWVYYSSKKGGGKGKGKSKGKFSDGFGKFGKSDGFGKSKGKTKGDGKNSGKSKGKSWKAQFEYAFSGANTPWWMA